MPPKHTKPETRHRLSGQEGSNLTRPAEAPGATQRVPSPPPPALGTNSRAPAALNIGQEVLRCPAFLTRTHVDSHAHTGPHPWLDGDHRLSGLASPSPPSRRPGLPDPSLDLPGTACVQRLLPAAAQSTEQAGTCPDRRPIRGSLPGLNTPRSSENLHSSQAPSTGRPPQSPRSEPAPGPHPCPASSHEHPVPGEERTSHPAKSTWLGADLTAPLRQSFTGPLSPSGRPHPGSSSPLPSSHLLTSDSPLISFY